MSLFKFSWKGNRLSLNRDQKTGFFHRISYSVVILQTYDTSF